MELSEKLPLEHIAIIMDGNRRWAKENGMQTKEGHKAGAKNLEDISKFCNKIGLKYLTVYAFSTENWKRSEEEVKGLMMLLKSYLDSFTKKAQAENIKLNILGDVTVLSTALQNSIKNALEKTKDNTGLVLNIAFNYGGRDEIKRAVKLIAEKVQKNEINIDNITESTISDNLYTKGQPDPDLLIRTSMELRTSNFLPWQLVHSEFLFVDKYWPDFKEEDLIDAIEIYKKRNRKFGGK